LSVNPIQRKVKETKIVEVKKEKIIKKPVEHIKMRTSSYVVSPLNLQQMTALNRDLA